MTSYGLGDRGSIAGRNRDFFLFSSASIPTLGSTQPCMKWITPLGVVWIWPPTSTSAKLKNTWSYNSAPPYVFMAWCLVKHRNNFTFTFCRAILLLMTDCFSKVLWPAIWLSPAPLCEFSYAPFYCLLLVLWLSILTDWLTDLNTDVSTDMLTYLLTD